MNRFDVFIIGAGPAGAKAAKECLKKGLSVAVADRKSVPGLPVHCGECISLYAFENTLVYPPESCISKRVEGVRVTFPGDRSAFLGEKGVVLNKDIFEKWLLEDAESNGAKVFLKAKVKDLRRSDQFWQIKAGPEKFESKIVIDASGVSSTANRILKITESFKYTVGLQYEVERDEQSSVIDFFIHPDYAKNGYLWIIPKGSGRFNVGALSTESHNLKKNLKKFLDKKGFKERNFRTSVGKIPSSGPLPQTFSQGLIIIGDAAGFTSPLFEGGTHLALKSACFAADAAKEYLSAQKSNLYEKKWKKSFPDYSRILRGKERLYGLSHQDLKRLGTYLPKEVTYHNFFDKLISGLKILINDPDLISKGAVDIMRAFEYSKAKHYGW